MSAQETVADWFPLHAGDKWVYEYTRRDNIGEGRAHLDSHTWTTEETTTGQWVVPEGMLIGRQVRIIAGSPPGGRRVDPNPAFLIRGDCLYGEEYGEAAWDPLTHQVTPDFRQALSIGSVSPDFCFPFAVQKSWGAPNGLPHWGVASPEEAKDWKLVGIKFHDPAAPDRQNTFHVANISSYPGGGITVDIWFEKGVGVVREEEIHHGTFGELRTRLLRFEPAVRK